MIRYYYRFKDENFTRYLGLVHVKMYLGRDKRLPYERYTLIDINTGELLAPDIWFDGIESVEEFLRENGIILNM